MSLPETSLPDSITVCSVVRWPLQRGKPFLGMDEVSQERSLMRERQT